MYQERVNGLAILCIEKILLDEIDNKKLWIHLKQYCLYVVLHSKSVVHL